MRKNQEFRIKFVKHRETSAGPVTSFSVGEKQKDSDQYVNYNVTVWGSAGATLNDDDTIKVAEIESFQVRPFVDKNNQNRLAYEVTVKIAGAQESNGTQPTASPSMPRSEPAFVAPKEDPYNLPFDL